MAQFDTSVLDTSLRKRRESLETQRLALQESVIEALREIRGKYGIREAYLIGSLTAPHRWYPFSDVDVAVSGCSAYLLSVMKDLEEATGREVDVIDLERHPRPASVRAGGVRVYG